MSLIVHTIVKDGIVVSADSRTTCKQNGETRYNDTADKITPFPNRIVVSHSGDASMTDKLNVTTFLLRLRKKIGLKVSLRDLPLTILNEYLKSYDGKNRDTVFLVSGCGEDLFYGCETYRVYPKDKTVSLVRKSGQTGASFSGTTEIAYQMMNNAVFDNMSLKEAIDLTETTVSSNITIYKYCESQIIGGEMQTYIIDTANLESGWLKDGVITPDKDAPDNGRQIYSDKMINKIIEQRDKTKGRK